MVRFPKGGLSERPLCEFCGERPGIHAIPTKNPGNFIAACHPCYVEYTQPVTKADLKNIIKEAIKEYENRNDKA